MRYFVDYSTTANRGGDLPTGVDRFLSHADPCKILKVHSLTIVVKRCHGIIYVWGASAFQQLNNMVLGMENL